MAKTLKELHEDEGKKPFKATPTEGPDKGKDYQFIEPKGDDFEGVELDDPGEDRVRRSGDVPKWKKK